MNIENTTALVLIKLTPVQKLCKFRGQIFKARQVYVKTARAKVSKNFHAIL